MKKYNGIVLCLFMAVSSHFFCSTMNVAGGSSSTDNGKVLGMISRENGLPAPHALVTLRPTDFDPLLSFDSLRTVTTDAAGDYSFTSVARGSYTVEAVALDAATRAFVNSVTVDSTIAYAPVAALTRPGAIKVRVPDDGAGMGRYVYIPGTSHFGMVQNGIGFIDSVPAGLISTVRYNDLENPVFDHTIKTGFSLSSGATREIADYALWKYSQKLFLNTTINGAGVSGAVLNFPVLVRLSSADFNFNQAKSDGSDLRFKNADDSPLAYEIERWDAGNQRAEIWVKVDTVHGNDSAHFFSMYWGNASATVESNGTSVFDTSAGFEGVWHLSGDGAATAHDATVNAYHGTPYNMTAASAVEGAVGTARDFNGSSSYIAMQNTAASRLNFPEGSDYSMSLWVYTDTIDTIWHAIAGKGHEQYYMQLKCLGRNRATWEFVEFRDQRGWEYTEDSFPPAPGPKQWLYLTGVRSGSSQRFYINGERVVDTAALMAGSYARNTGDNFSIGRYGRSVAIPYYQGWSYFKGRVDEVRISKGELTSDWIRLCYMNQKTDDALVVFK
jgi:hypothetical protein